MVEPRRISHKIYPSFWFFSLFLFQFRKENVCTPMYDVPLRLINTNSDLEVNEEKKQMLTLQKSTSLIDKTLFAKPLLVPLHPQARWSATIPFLFQRGHI